MFVERVERILILKKKKLKNSVRTSKLFYAHTHTYFSVVNYTARLTETKIVICIKNVFVSHYRSFMTSNCFEFSELRKDCS